MKKKISKVTSAKMAKLASKTLKGYEPSRDEIEALAASVMSQREREIELKAAAEAPAAAPASVEAPAAEAPVMLVEPAPAAEPLPALAISGEALTQVEEILMEEAAPAEPVAEEAPANRGFWSNLFTK